ncbi:hypothetical protein Pfo_019403, partial [Paulownia fortunei]
MTSTAGSEFLYSFLLRPTIICAAASYVNPGRNSPLNPVFSLRPMDFLAITGLFSLLPAPLLAANAVPVQLHYILNPRKGIYTVGDFMSGKEDLHVLETLVENSITGFPVMMVNGSWYVGLVSDYNLLALDSISGGSKGVKHGKCLLYARPFCSLVISPSLFISNTIQLHWPAFNEVQNLLSKTNGKSVGDLMIPAPVVIRESTNLEETARYPFILDFSEQL